MKDSIARDARYWIAGPAALLALAAGWIGMETLAQRASAQAPARTPRPLITPLPAKPKKAKEGAPLQPMQAQAPLQPLQAGAPQANANSAGTTLVPPPKAVHTPAPPPLEHPESVAPYHPKGLTLFYMGNRTSEIEPCGCVKNQLGGIQYEATLYEAAKRDESLRLEVGGWMARNRTSEGGLKALYALQAMGGFLDFDAINVGQPDLALGKIFFEELKTKRPDSAKRLVSANIYPAGDSQELVFDPIKFVERKTVDGKSVRCAIAGLTNFTPPLPNQPISAGDEDYRIEAPNKSFAAIWEKMKDADLKVVLFHSNWPEAVALAGEFPQIDVIVCVNQAPDFQKKFDYKDRTLILGNYSTLGKQLGRVDLTRDDAGVWKPTENPGMLGVSPKALKANPLMVELIQDYKKHTEELLVPVPNNAKQTFAGMNSCASCHLKEYNQWQTTKHSRALESLAAKGSQFDGECLKCHTLGFKQDNGFYNAKQSQHMANVQCESCHGPAKEHVNKQTLISNRSIESMVPAEKEKFLAEAKAAIPPKAVPESTCVQCHYGENDPHFVYKDYIHKVDHSDAPTASLREALSPLLDRELARN